MSDEEEHRLIAERRAKLAKLRERGVAFPNDFRRDSLAGDLQSLHSKNSAEDLARQTQRVRIAGRLRAKRVMGKVAFARLDDESGSIQLFLQRDRLAEGYAEFKSMDVGDFIGASGSVFRTQTGELTVDIDELRLLTKSLRALPDKWHGVADTELRYRRRYVDLIMNAESRQVFRARSQILRFIRSFLDSRGFLEVETPMLQPLPGGAVAKPFKTHHNALDLEMYLRIAPELYLKRLTVGGLERVYEINRNFRNEGVSTRHNPEFTMLELYQAYATYEDLIALVEGLMRGIALDLRGESKVTYQGAEFDLSAPFDRLTIEQIIVRETPGLDAARVRDVAYLRTVCDRLGIGYAATDGAGKLQIELFERQGEASLQRPTFAYAYPTEVSPLSRRNDADPFLSDRFEFFVAGREIANGFSELNDPEDQAQRFKEQAARKAAGDEEAMYYDADYVRALEYGMPPAAGIGIGIDRLVMFFTDSASIRDVLLFPHMRPE